MTTTEIASSVQDDKRPQNIRGLTPEQRDNLAISTRSVGGRVIVLSHYGDDQWHLVGHPTNRAPSERSLSFAGIAPRWRQTLKEILYWYMRRGRDGRNQPSPRSVIKLLADVAPFLRHLERLNVERFGAVTPMTCAAYVHTCKSHVQASGTKRSGKPLKASSLGHRFWAVEALHELSQHTGDPMPHPWPDTSSAHLAGLTGPGTAYRGGGTPLIPDDVFTTLFQRAWSLVQQADALLDLRDEAMLLREACGLHPYTGIMGAHERQFLRSRGWSGTTVYRQALLEVRTACYVVMASLSGCRNQELAFVESGACYCTEHADTPGEEPQVYWWMRSQSTKTGAGRTEWMVPPAAVSAVKVMERWVRPYRAMLEAEIAMRQTADPHDPEIAEAQDHVKALFLAATPQSRNQVRTMSGQMWNVALKAFAKNCGVTWKLASHQFRRKFANYAARSQFGDLRYLRDHFKHWSMDMTLGYALNESQEMDLYAEIQHELDDIKDGVVTSWLEPGARLGGGYGANISSWRAGQPVTMFKNHRQMVRSLADSTAIRSNGHAWCTADDNMCVGNDIERTRCAGCENAVIGSEHVPLYEGLLEHLTEVRDCPDIGEGGAAVVQRDMERCRGVLSSLGQDASEVATQ